MIETFWDSSTLSFSVKKNNVAYSQNGSTSIQVIDDVTNAKLLQPIDTSYRTVSLLVPSFCVGTTQYLFEHSWFNEFGMWQGTSNEWPYIHVTEIANSNVCATSPVIPDLAWSGVPTITHATSATSNDGGITYSATSSYSPILYVMGGFSPFSPGSSSPTYQNPFIPGTGSGLAPGSYVWWAKDAKGFTITYNFTIVDLSQNIASPPLVIPDIYWPGTPTISQDTGPGNGSITFTAVSSYAPIQYSLRDIVYGQGQASSTFSNLYASSYTLYAVDSKNCKISYQFTIPLNGAVSTPAAGARADGTIYQLKVTDFNLRQHVVNILKAGYTGQPTQLDGGNEDPIVYSLRLDQSTDKFSPVGAAQLALCLKSATNFSLQELFNTTADIYRVQYYCEGILKLVSKIYPQSYSEDYNESVSYPVNITATDGLIELDDIDYVDDNGNRFKGTQRAIEVIAQCLAKLRFNLNIRVACNLYASGMATTAADDPLDQSYVDNRSYYTDADALSCLEVIKRIISPSTGSIVQWGGYWYIVRWEELVKSSVDFREYDPKGTYVSNSSMAPIVDIRKSEDTRTRLTWTGASTTLDMVLPQGNIEVTYKQGLLKSLLKNADFSVIKQNSPYQQVKEVIDTSGFVIVNNSDTALTTGLAKVENSLTNVALVLTGTGLAYIMGQVPSFVMGFGDKIKIAIRYRIDDTLSTFRYQKVKMRISHGSYYLQQDGNWTTTVSEIYVYEKDFNKWKSTEIIAKSYILIGSATVTSTLSIRVYSSWVSDAEFTSFASQKTKVTAGLPSGYRTESLILNTLYYYELEASALPDSNPDVVQPADYGTSGKNWILKQTFGSVNTACATSGNIQIDFINLNYLPQGQDLYEDSIEQLSPQNSKKTLKKTLYHGSSVATQKSIFSSITNLFNGKTELTPTQVANNNPTITHINYLRKSDGTQWILWTRDAVAESTFLQSIYLKSYAAQYRMPIRRLTGSLSSRQVNDSITPVYLTPISMLKENYDGKFYRPMGYSYHVRQCEYQGEFLEIVDITAGGTSTSGGLATTNATFNSSFG
ncbi:MAG TPA: hypothetical protein PK059_02090 [Cyclobacteriaceae bacterium]|nr:hypothetical protein [Cyclobacteriaceae bacterium]